MSRPSFDRIVAIQQFVADFSRIARVPQLADTNRPENDVEHSFGLALTCWFLAPKIAPELSLEKILCYALAHDAVELHAGDTFIFGPEQELLSKSDREDKAIEKLAAEWPDFQELTAYTHNYKNKADGEAKFVYAVDKLLAAIMVNLGEKDSFWRRHQITQEMLEADKEPKVKASPYIAPYYEEFIAWLTSPDYFYKEGQ
jgi:putative hydrolases of HD superfamily